MAEGRIKTLRRVLQPRLVRWGLGAVALLGGYDVLCNQLGLPPIKSIAGLSVPSVAVPASILPWWGWLLMLQIPFTYGLFEYVRNNIRAQDLAPETLRRLNDPAPRQLFWQRPLEVLTTFDPEANARIAEARDAITAFDEETAALTSDRNESASSNHSSWEGMSFSLQRDRDRRSLVDRYNQMLSARVERLRRLLEAGAFISQGYVAPRVAGAGPKDIPPEEWRLLQFQADNLENAAGGGSSYLGIRIAKPN